MSHTHPWGPPYVPPNDGTQAPPTPSHTQTPATKQPPPGNAGASHQLPGSGTTLGPPPPKATAQTEENDERKRKIESTDNATAKVPRKAPKEPRPFSQTVAGLLSADSGIINEDIPDKTTLDDKDKATESPALPDIRQGDATAPLSHNSTNQNATEQKLPCKAPPPGSPPPPFHNAPLHPPPPNPPQVELTKATITKERASEDLTHSAPGKDSKASKDAHVTQLFLSLSLTQPESQAATEPHPNDLDYCYCQCGRGQNCIVARRALDAWVLEDEVFL